MKPLAPAAEAQSDRILRDLQQIMFAYDVGILKRADRLEEAQAKIEALSHEFADIAAPHVHELVRLKETEAMLLAARMILRASLERTESRLSHFREDYETRDDQNWLAWVDITDRNGELGLERTPIPTPLCSVEPVRRPARLKKQLAVGAAD
jgi:succinate dehydrogenase/fumarate reductase flavoprotein subunit